MDPSTSNATERPLLRLELGLVIPGCTLLLQSLNRMYRNLSLLIGVYAALLLAANASSAQYETLSNSLPFYQRQADSSNLYVSKSAEHAEVDALHEVHVRELEGGDRFGPKVFESELRLCVSKSLKISVFPSTLFHPPSLSTLIPLFLHTMHVFLT